MRENRRDGLGKREEMWDISVEPHVLDLFTVPFLATSEEQKLLEQFRLEVDKRYQTGLIIWRFQPVHYGHIFLIKQALEITHSIIIGIGSSNERNADNPWSIEQREQRLARVVDALAIKERVFKIVRLSDYMNDDLWLEETLRKTGDVDVVVGNNDWVNSIFARANYPVITTPFYHRDMFEGRRIREYLRFLQPTLLK